MDTQPGLHSSKSICTSVAQLPAIIPMRIHLSHCLVLICILETFTAWQQCLVCKLRGKQTRPHNMMPFNEAWVVLRSNSRTYNLRQQSVKQHLCQNVLPRSACNHHLSSSCAFYIYRKSYVSVFYSIFLWEAICDIVLEERSAGRFQCFILIY